METGNRRYTDTNEGRRYTDRASSHMSRAAILSQKIGQLEQIVQVHEEKSKAMDELIAILKEQNRVLSDRIQVFKTLTEIKKGDSDGTKQPSNVNIVIAESDDPGRNRTHQTDDLQGRDG